MAKITALVSLLLLGLLGVTATASADTDASEWSTVNIPAAGSGGGWVLAPGSDLSHLSPAGDGSLYALLKESTPRLMRSDDGGLSWTETGYAGEVVDIVGTRDGLYLTDGTRVYKSADGTAFNAITAGGLPVFDENESISCLDVGYDGSHHPLVFIGTADSDPGQWGGVYYLDEGGFGAEWTDMMAAGYDIRAIAAAPQFDHDFHLVALGSDASRSYILNNEGVIGEWTPAIELLKDNVSSFAADSASRIRFTADFEAFYELFVGVRAGGNGGVFRVNQTDAYDSGIDADVVSLALAEDGESLELLAGGAGGGLWHSPDAGESWAPSRKAPSGDGAVYVSLAADYSESGLAYAASGGSGSAFSRSLDGGLTWNQLSLIDAEIDDIVDLAPSPAYSLDNVLFMLTADDGEHSLWRRRDGDWERILYGGPSGVLDMVALSPGYHEDNVVLVAGVGDGKASIWRSEDGGQSFRRRVTPLTVDVWAIVDGSNWFIGGFDGDRGRVYRVSNGGVSYPSGADVGDQPLSSISISPEYGQDETIVAGNEAGRVYLSGDNGQNFAPLPPSAVSGPLSGRVSVAFDPGYASNGIVYAAGDSPGEGIYRFVISDSGWENIDRPEEGMIGATALSASGVLYAANFAADGGMERCLDPRHRPGASFDSVTKGLDDGARMVGLWIQEQNLWSIDSANVKLMSYCDGLTTPVGLVSPLNGAPGVGLVIGEAAINVSLDWESLPGATSYQWQLNYDADFSSLPDGFEGTTGSTSVHLPDLAPAATYYWRVRAVEPSFSPWSERWSFNTGLGQEITAPLLESPASGAENVPPEPIFQWSAIAGADAYELIISTYATFDNPTILKTADYALPSTAWQCNVTLDYETTYYWKVRAVSADSCSAWSAVGAFSTGAARQVTGSIAEAEMTAPETNENSESEWPDWLWPAGGAALAFFLVVLVAILVVMIMLVVKVSKL